MMLSMDKRLSSQSIPGNCYFRGMEAAARQDLYQRFLVSGLKRDESLAGNGKPETGNGNYGIL
jgi:hypothetical protein